MHIFLTDASIAAPFFCRMGGARVIVSRRDMGFWYTPATLAALRFSNLFVSCIVANSDAVRRNVHERERYPLAAMEVVPNGHDPRRFDLPPDPDLRERLGIAPSDPIVGMVANFNPWKRHDDLLQAFAVVKRQHPRAHLVLAGAGPTESATLARARELGLASSVHFLGGIENVVAVVKHFTVGVLCSESEGSSNAVIEYMGCSKPTVCTNVGGNREFITDNETGFLIAPGDVSALAARLSSLLASPASCEAIGHRAGRVAQRLTTQRMAESHMNVYERLVRSSGSDNRGVRVQCA